MRLRWLSIGFRCAAIVLLLVAILMFFGGGLAFRSESQTSADTYVIRHTLVLPYSAIVPAALGVILFACSFFIGSKRV